MSPIIPELTEPRIPPGWKVLRGPVVPRSAQNKVSAEFRSGCLGPCQADNTFRDWDSTTLPLNLLQCFLTLTVSTVLLESPLVPVLAIVSWCSSVQAQAPL